MKVTQTGNNHSSEVTGAHGARNAHRSHGHRSADGTASATGSGESSRTEISSRAKEMAHAKHVASTSPEIREQKIAELRRRIAEGSYKVDADAVADKMVDDHLHMSGIG